MSNRCGYRRRRLQARSSGYAKQRRASAETRDWLKHRFVWD